MKMENELKALAESILDAVPPDACASPRQTDEVRRLARVALRTKENVGHPLNERELATVLAALRAFQSLTNAGRDYADYGIRDDHFEKCEPLDDEEIDALCERLNS
jgi:hypothetical protein